MKYFKFFNKEETHHGLKYKTGLNVDPIEFYTASDCSSGGMYFVSSEQAFTWALNSNFSDDYEYVREVKLPKDCKFHTENSGIEKHKADKIILGKRRNILDLDTFKWLIDSGALHNSYILSVYIKKCSDSGKLDASEYIITHYKKDLGDNYQYSLNDLISNTIRYGTVDDLKKRLKKYKTSYVDSYDVMLCIKYGKLDILKYITKSKKLKSLYDTQKYLGKILFYLDKSKESLECFKFYISKFPEPFSIDVDLLPSMGHIEDREILEFLKPFINFSKIRPNKIHDILHYYTYGKGYNFEFLEFLLSNKKYTGPSILNLLRGGACRLDKNVFMNLYKVMLTLHPNMDIKTISKQLSGPIVNMMQCSDITAEDLKILLKDIPELDPEMLNRNFNIQYFMLNANIDTTYKFEIIKKYNIKYDSYKYTYNKHLFVNEMVRIFIGSDNFTINDFKIMFNNLNLLFPDINDSWKDSNIAEMMLIYTSNIENVKDSKKLSYLLKLIKESGIDLSKMYGSYICSLYNNNKSIMKFLLNNGVNPKSKEFNNFDMVQFRRDIRSMS